MPRNLKVLDLFCCAGGAGTGYHRAGFDVLGVDIKYRPNYPFDFVRHDAVSYLSWLVASDRAASYNLIHTSPPCQEACALTQGTNKGKPWEGNHQQLIPALRPLLEASGVPYVIEQPVGKAPIRSDLTLCGEQFGLGVLRHRNFELGNWHTPKLPHVKHRGYVRGMRHGVWRDGPYIAAYGNGGGKGSVTEMQGAMGIYWTDVREELTEAIPPAYTEFIGNRFVEWTRRG